jgi:CheY-like chemotaxis protein
MLDQGMSSAQQQQDASEKAVLIVEDHFYTRWGAAEYLRQSGHRVFEAMNVAEAIAIMSSGTHIDIVFSDINMPGGQDGYFLAQWLEKTHPSIPILLTSGDPLNSGAHTPGPGLRFIRKPYDPVEVEQILLSMLA